MDERDDSLGQLYRRSSREEPPAQVDLAVLNMARRTARRKASWSPFGGNWLAGGAVTAVALLSVVLVTLMRDRPTGPVPPDAAEEAGGISSMAEMRREESLEAGRVRLALPPAGKRLEETADIADQAARQAPAVAASVAGDAATSTPPEDAPESARAGPPQPRFDFYKTLPEATVAAPPPVATPQRPAAPPLAESVAGGIEAELPAAPATASTPPAPEADRLAVPATISAAAATPAPPVTPAIAPAAPAPAAVTATAPPAAYYLQVGAFRAVDTAERLRVRLVALGLPASVEAIELGNREVWHRVRVGPYRETAAVDAARARLRAEGIDSMLVK